MSNYNTTLQSNNTDLQAILNTINGLPEAGGSDPVLQDKTVTPSTASQTVTADSNYDGLSKVTVNAMPTATQATPSITINASGLITATATQTAGYVAAGSKSATKQLAFQAAKTITPTTTNQTAVSSGYYTGGAITVKGDSNLVAGNIKNGVSIFGVNGTYEGSGGSGSGGGDELITRAITSYTNDRVTTIGSYAFTSCTSLTHVNFSNCSIIHSYAFSLCRNLTYVSFPKCTSIGGSAFHKCFRITSVSFPVCTSIDGCAFMQCSSLTYVSFPKCIFIHDSAFMGCTNLTSISFPVCEAIRVSAFMNCINLTSINFPVCETISSYAFANCKNLTYVSFPKCTSIGISAFVSCTNLTSVSFPVCTSIDPGAFMSCTNLTSISFPVCTSIDWGAFMRCSSLTYVSFPKCASIGRSAFMNCTNLTKIYLAASSRCTLGNSNAFSNTGIGSNKGSIFVPASLVSSYKTATNWTYFSNRIYSIK